MKKLFTIIILFLTIISFTPNVYALTPTPSAAPSGDEEQIERIKDIVASRVAELNLVEKKGVLGTVVSSTSTQITISDLLGKKRIIEIDEITKFSDPDNDDFGISDIENGDKIGVIGLLNKAADRILARYINASSSIPEYFEGVVVEVDSKNFQFLSIDENGKQRIIDIVPSTKTQMFTKEDGTVKSGFSKIEIGERVFAAGFTDTKNKNQLNARRVIHFPDLSPSEKMKKSADAKSGKITPTVTPEE